MAVCIISSLLWLNVSSDESRLFSEKLPFRRDNAEFSKQFPENDALYVVIEAKDPSAIPTIGRWTGAADAIVRAVQQVPAKYVDKVDAHVPLDQLAAQALLFEKPGALRDDIQSIARFGDLARLWAEKNPGFGGVPLGFLLGRTPIEHFLAALTIHPDPQALPLLTHMARGWTTALQDPAAPIAVGAAVPDLGALQAQNPGDMGYYWQADSTDPNARLDPDKARHMLLVRVFPHVDNRTLSTTAEPVVAIRKAVRQAAADYREFEIGATGRPALDADEMASTDRASKVAEIIAVVAVFIGLMVMLRSLWLALAAELALGVGIGWTFGWATLSLHELNLLSIVFLIALIGIGMDYLVQVLSRYRAEARRHARPKAIWLRVFHSVAAPINTACLGAAAAFFVSVFTNFRGAADLGIIAGGGLLLCLLSGYTVLPALLTLFPPRLKMDTAKRTVGPPPRRFGPVRLIFPAIWVCVVASLLPWINKAQFDPNLLKLQAPNLESTRLIRKIQTWSDVVLSKDLTMLAQVRAALQKTSVVGETESVLNAQDNYNYLLAHQDQLPKIAWAEPTPVMAGDVRSIASRASALADKLAGATDKDGPAAHDRQATIEALKAFAVAADQAPADRTAARLAIWQTVFVKELHGVLAQFTPQPLDLSKTPVELRSHLVSLDGTYALHIYAKPQFDLWDREALRQFVTAAEAAVATVPNHPPLTGQASEVFYTTREVHAAFVHATTYALIAIVILVLLDLRSVAHTLLAVSVLGLGLPLLVELMGVFNIDWNFANFFGVPILIGAGHEYGVFMIHRYREALRDPRRAWRFWDVADRALLLCAYITSTSFGFFWLISEHRGLKSLGLVMALGTACIYLSTITVLRPLLLWRLERHAASQEREAPVEQTVLVEQPAPSAE